MLNIKEPMEYLPYLNKYRNQSKYNKDVKLHIEKKCNRHTDTSGYSWGLTTVTEQLFKTI